MDGIGVLEKNKEISYKGGGPAKIEMQHNLHKFTARERIESIFDLGSFVEIGGLINNNGAGVITGYGTILGKLVYIYSQDYTVSGGAIDKVNSKKICNIMDMAVKMGVPLIQILDSIGGKLTEGIDMFKNYGDILKENAKISGVIPQISIIAGPCSGIGAFSAAMSDFTIIVENTGELYINSPNRLTKIEETYIDISMYANSDKTTENGNVQLVARDDNHALKLARRLIEYLPSNNLEHTPLNNEVDELNFDIEKLNQISNDENYSMLEVIESVSDKDKFIELNSRWAKGIITGLSKIYGMTVGIVGTNNKAQAYIGTNECQKTARFIRVCNAFNIPIISLVDTKGFAINLEEELKGLTILSSKILYALADADVPKISVIIGKAYGSAYMALASKEVSFDTALAWPNSKICITEPEVYIKSLYKEEITSDANPAVKEGQIIKQYMDEVTSPYKAAEKGYIDDIIFPSQTKSRLFASLDMLMSKRELKYPKKHGNAII